MAHLSDDHRGYSIFTHASGPLGGRWLASYSAWPVRASASSGAFCEGAVRGLHRTQDHAHRSAAVQARRSVDALLDQTLRARA
jgi:hypothetical protein